MAKSSPETLTQKKTTFKSFTTQNLILCQPYFTLAASLTWGMSSSSFRISLNWNNTEPFELISIKKTVYQDVACQILTFILCFSKFWIQIQYVFMERCIYWHTVYETYSYAFWIYIYGNALKIFSNNLAHSFTNAYLLKTTISLSPVHHTQPLLHLYYVLLYVSFLSHYMLAVPAVDTSDKSDEMLHCNWMQQWSITTNTKTCKPQLIQFRSHTNNSFKWSMILLFTNFPHSKRFLTKIPYAVSLLQLHIWLVITPWLILLTKQY
jgi:hypothetical protein